MKNKKLAIAKTLLALGVTANLAVAAAAPVYTTRVPVIGLRPATQSAANSTPSDPYFAYVTSLVHMDGLNGGSTFSDVKGNAVNVVGTYVTATSNKMYGSASGYSTGTGGLTVHSSRTIGSSDFTIEGWVYLTSAAGVYTLFDGRPEGGNGNYPGISFDNNALQYYVNYAYQITGPTIPTNTWNHFAVSRVSGTTRMFFNGSQVGKSWADATNYGGGDFDISANRYAWHSQNYVKGYMDDVRITIGVGRYSTNFAVPSVFPDK